MVHATLRAHWRLFSVAAVLALLTAAVPFSIFTPSTALGDSDWVVTSLADDESEGTLRYAVDNSEEGDTITFDSSLSGTLTLDPVLGQLIVDHPLTIVGPGANRVAISGAEETRVFFIKGPRHHEECPHDDTEPEGGCCGVENSSEPGDCAAPTGVFGELDAPDVTISGLTIQNGFPKYPEPFPCIPADPDKDPHGPACFGGNVLCVRISVALADCVIENGFAEQGGGVAARNDADILIQDCTIVNNVAGPTDTEFERNGHRDGHCEYTNSGGGIDIRNHSHAVVEDSTISDNEAEDGGGIAARSNGSWMVISRCSITGNATQPINEPTETEPAGYYANITRGGGGIFAKKVSLKVEDSIIDGNTALDSHWAYGGGGGILLKRCWADINNCSITDNTAGGVGWCGLGGGIACVKSDALLSTCSITGNTAGDGSLHGVGGGVYLGRGNPSVAPDASEEPGGGCDIHPTDISHCLIANNTAGSSSAALAVGGGIAVGRLDFLNPESTEPADDPSELPGGMWNIETSLTNCTISGNSAIAIDSESYGGGLGAPDSKKILVNFTTITDNTAAEGSGAFTAYGSRAGEPESGMPQLKLKNSIVAGNHSLRSDSDIAGGWDSWEGNVLCAIPAFYSDEPEDCTPEEDCFRGDCGDIFITDSPYLGPLSDNGGPTLTHALLPGCPAVDAACDARGVCLVDNEPDSPEELVITTDQRGEPRPFDGDNDGEAVNDAGAFESVPDIDLPDVTSNTVNAGSSTADDCIQVRVLVKNEGAATLVIDDIVVIGSQAFSVVDDYNGVAIEGGDSTYVTLLYCPTRAGTDRGTLRIISNDPDEAPLEVSIVGMGRSGKADAEPAKMGTSYLSVDPVQVLPGQEVIISANICNSGEESGSQTASLAVNGVAEQSQSVTVSGGSCKQVVFRVARAVPGTYNVSIDGMQGQFTVLAPRVVQSSVPSQQDNGLGTAGIIAIIAVALVLIGALVVIFKQT